MTSEFSLEGIRIPFASYKGALSRIAKIHESRNYMSKPRGLLIIGVGLKLLAIRDVKVADFLPAIVVSPFVVAAIGRLLEALGK